ncbi:MAG: hypothetical protein EBZ48_01045 [Proteobacteria bacterium]|nr:hypothetical protein [Pseudomonadota bacterium]
MAITRRQSLIISGASLLLFFAVGIIFLNSNRRSVPIASVSSSIESSSFSSSPGPGGNAETAGPTTAQPPDAQASSEGGAPGIFTMHEFHRSEVRDGKKLWEVKGSQAQYSPEDSSVRIVDADLSLLAKNGKEGRLRTKKATLYMQGPTLTKAHLAQGVTAIYDGEYTLTSEEAICDRIANTVMIPGPVNIEGSAIRLSGNSLKGDIDAQNFVVTGNVVTIINPHPKNPTRIEQGAKP